MRGFDYFSPIAIPEVLTLLRTYGDQAKILAGGTDLLLQMQADEIKPRYVIDLKRVREFQGLRYSPDRGLTIHPLTRIADLASMDDINGGFLVLREAAQTIGSVQIRNRATIGGNICRAAPSADMVPGLMVLNSQIQIKGADKERWVPLADFFVGPGRTILQPHELLAEIHVPIPPPGGIAVYLKLGPRQAMDLATVGAAVFLRLDSDGALCQDVRIALASVAPKPIRAFESEKMLIGNLLSPSLISQAACRASFEANPITDVYGPDWYKRQMVEVLTKRAILEATKRIRGKDEIQNSTHY